MSSSISSPSKRTWRETPTCEKWKGSILSHWKKTKTTMIKNTGSVLRPESPEAEEAEAELACLWSLVNTILASPSGTRSLNISEKYLLIWL